MGTVRAGHGYADPSFRPPSLPFASLVGPLSIDVEPERDPAVASDVLIQLPGVLRGQPRVGEVVPAGATLDVVLDEDARVQIVLAGGDFSTTVAARAVCQDVESKLRTAAAEQAFVDGAGIPIVNAQRLLELSMTACRWDEEGPRVTLSSGRLGYARQLLPSTVVVAGGSSAEALGFAPPSRGEPGRYARHRAPAPSGYSVDTRLDLWAASQRDLGYMIDALIGAVPTRTRVITRPALLAQDAKIGDTTIRLLDAGEPTLDESLLHLELTDGLTDRVVDIDLHAGAGVTLSASGVTFTGTGSAGRVLARAPVVPDPRRTDTLAPQGLALTLGLTLIGAEDGHTGSFVALDSGGQTVVELAYRVLTAQWLGQVMPLVELSATALLLNDSNANGVATTVRRLPLSHLEAGAPVHVVVQAGVGRVTLSIEGDSQDLSNTDQTPLPPVAFAGRLALDEDLSIRLGNPAGNPSVFRLDHVHLLREPFPALDPRLRRSVNGARNFRPGDYIALAVSDTGRLPAGTPEAFYVRAVSGAVVTLDRPISQRFRRARTIVHSRDCFVQQRDVKRRDDLMNRLYRYCVGYRISAFLEQTNTNIIGSLVIQPVVEVDAKTSSKNASGAPGVRSCVLNEPIVVVQRQPQSSQE